MDKGFRDVLGRLEQEFPNVSVVFSDVLRIRFADFRASRAITVMGNIPYYLTGEILFKLLFEKTAIKGAYLTMQKEVAQRIVSPSHSRSYGALSVIFQLLCRGEGAPFAQALALHPSSEGRQRIHLHRLQRRDEPDRGLIAFVKQCFHYKRKYLRHSLARHYRTGRDRRRFTGISGFRRSIRAEEIEPEGFVEMYRTIEGSKEWS